MKKTIIIILLTIVLLMASLACRVDGGDPTPTGWQPTEAHPLNGLFATATYGAQEWHMQLTAIAETPEP